MNAPRIPARPITDPLAISLAEDFAGIFGRSADSILAEAAYSVTDLLATQRAEDEGRTVWRVFNRIQENASKGGQPGRSATGRAIRSRLIGGITSSATFNSGLWNLAAEVAEAATAKAARKARES